MTKRTKKRFIAGAVCPKCKAMDSIMLFLEDNVEKLACTQCDYQETKADEKVEAQTRSNENVIGVFKP